MGVPVLFVDSVGVGWSGKTPILSFSCRGDVLGIFALEDAVWKFIRSARHPGEGYGGHDEFGPEGKMGE
jgi:hypothetical protein